MGPHSLPRQYRLSLRRNCFAVIVTVYTSLLSLLRDAQQTRPGAVGSGPWKARRSEDLSDDLLEQGVQFCGLDRFLQHGCVRKRRNDTVRPVAGDEGKRDFSVGENIGDGIGFFATQIHVENTRLQVSALRREYGVAE